MIENNRTVSTAESLTGGMLASAFVNNAGSSAFFNGGIVAYQDRIKNKVLNVPYDICDIIYFISSFRLRFNWINCYFYICSKFIINYISIYVYKLCICIISNYTI